MDDPTIDVLIPVFNAAATVRESVGSMTAQTVRDIRLIVVDDGSTDDTAAILASMAEADRRIVVVSKPNSGIVDALNLGLTRCSAEFLARFDADDLAYPNRLERQVAYLQEHPDCSALGCDVDHIDELGAPIEGLPRPGSPSDADPAWIPAREPYLIHPYLLARREAVIRAGGYRHVPYSEDSDLYWRMAEHGRLHNLEERLGKYRMHMKSISGSSVVSGRIMAIGSQLGALSALRRRAGASDLVFSRDDHAALRAAQTLEAMHAHVSARLTPAEAERLRLAAGIKLLELTGYRPYELEESDCAFIRAALSLVDGDVAQVQKEVRWQATHAAARLLRKGMPKEALALIPPKFYPRVAAAALAG
jgi:glycosyltransferase involved in cell wall biosynthesis